MLSSLRREHCKLPIPNPQALLRFHHIHNHSHHNVDHDAPRSLAASLLGLAQAQHVPEIIASYARAFQALTGRSSLRLGRQVHAHMAARALRPTPFLAAKMVAMYASSGDLRSAVEIFRGIKHPSLLLFNSIIRAYSWHGLPERAIDTYLRMRSVGLSGDHFTFPFVLKSCVDLSSVDIGKYVHGIGVRIGFVSDVYVGTSLINMYVKCGEIGHACTVFDELHVRDVSSWNALIAGYMRDGEVGLAEDLFQRMAPSEKNVISWTAMISGYSQNGLATRALAAFDEMLDRDFAVKPTWVTIMSVLPACAQSAALERGREIHELASRLGFGSDVSVLSALVAMYAKCGSLAEAHQLFNKIPQHKKDLILWNTMISAYSFHGRGSECIASFNEMIGTGVRPDGVTFSALLSGCSHTGLVDLGLNYFHQMEKTYGVKPEAQHLASVVDLLGRAGRLDEAKGLIDAVATRVGASAWGALLAAARKHRNLGIAETAAEELFVLEPMSGANYVHLSNAYAEAGAWREVARVRDTVVKRGVRKTPGCSWIEVAGGAHVFLGGDTCHPQTDEIYALLDLLPEKLRAAGYVPDTAPVFHDISEEEKEQSLSVHSERLAVAFGLLRSGRSAVIRVTKNLRVCVDCHTWTKFVSKIFQREIVVRDVNRFHHFVDGSCSCGDYW